MSRKNRVPNKSEENTVDRFLKRLQESREYGIQFLITLELNKIEAQYQAPALPVVFLKKIDDLGIVQSFTINSFYQGLIPQPKTEFSADEVQAIANTFNRKRLRALNVMLMVGGVENIFSSVVGGEKSIAPIIKQFDKDGYPLAYALNMEVEVIENK